MNRVYYAHSLRKYGTPDEVDEQIVICHVLNAIVINPRLAIDQAAPDAMHQCFELVRKADGLAFSEYAGHIGRGVYAEVRLAQKLDKPVWLLRDGQLYDAFKIQEVGLDWAVRYAQVTL